MDNPFERYDLDPRDGIAAITQRLKELAEDAKTDAEREEIRNAWEQLTLHPAQRLRAAIFALPDTRAELGAPPMPSRVRPTGKTLADLDWRKIAARPSLILATGAGDASDEEPPPLAGDSVLRSGL